MLALFFDEADAFAEAFRPDVVEVDTGGQLAGVEVQCVIARSPGFTVEEYFDDAAIESVDLDGHFGFAAQFEAQGTGSTGGIREGREGPGQGDTAAVGAGTSWNRDGDQARIVAVVQ